jgi:hypothetical protein
LNMASGTPTASAAGNMLVMPWTNGGTQTGGFLGIGTTSPSYHLDLSSSRNDYLARIYNSNTGTSAGGLSIRIDGSGNILNLNANGTDVFTVNTAQATIGVPTQFTSTGDVSVAYDLLFTNPTASYIDSAANMFIRAGEVFNSSNLSFQTYNKGNILFNTEALSLTGSASIAGRLTVTESQSATHAATINNTSTNTAADGLLIKLGNTSTTVVSSTNHFVDFETAGIGIVGRIRGNGGANVAYETVGVADFAERLDKDPNEAIPFGAVVCQGTDGQVHPCAVEYSNAIVGISSEFPTFVGGVDKGPGSIAVGLSGQVRLKVSGKNGAINSGDMLTSSDIPGVAMKSTRAGSIIGRALQSFSGDTGEIMVVITPSWHDPNTYITASGNLSSTDDILNEAVNRSITEFNAQQDTTDEEETVYDLLSDEEYVTTKAKVETTADKVAALDQKIADLASASALMTDLVNSVASMSASPIADFESFGFTGDSATLSGTLNVLGRTTLSDLGVTGNITAGIISLNGIDGELNTIGGPLKLQSFGTDGIDILSGKIIIDTQGNMISQGTIAAKEVKAKKFTVDTSPVSTTSATLTASAGTVTVEAGETSIDVSTTALGTKSLIFATPDRAVAVGTKKKDADTFTITLGTAQGVDVKINWWIVDTDQTVSVGN